MQFNTALAAQSKVTDKQIQEATKEAIQQMDMYRTGIQVLQVIQKLLNEGEGGKVLTKRFSDKVKAALPGVNLYIIYTGTEKMSVSYGQPQSTMNLYNAAPAYLTYNFSADIERTIKQYDAALQGYKADLDTLPTFAAEYNAAISLVMDVMRKVPVLQTSGLKYRLPLMYFQGE